MKSIKTRKKMSKARKLWYKNNPKKAKEKAIKCSKTKIKQKKWKGKDNPNYGSKKFTGIPFKGRVWNKGLTKEIDKRVKRISDKNIGEKNPRFKGDFVGKDSLHEYIKRRKPKPKYCEKCSKNKPYDLANISGEYKRDVHDFKWICRRCHMDEDGRILNLKNQVKGGKKDGKNNC